MKESGFDFSEAPLRAVLYPQSSLLILINSCLLKLVLMHVFICGVNFEHCSSGDGHLVFRDNFFHWDQFGFRMPVWPQSRLPLLSPVMDGTAPQATCLASPPEFYVGSGEQT